MVLKCRVAIASLITSLADVLAILLFTGRSLLLVSAMVANEVNDPVRLRHRRELTAGAAEHFLLLPRMHRIDMNLERCCLEKLLLAVLALIGQLVLMLLHMIVHCILALLCYATLLTDKLTGSILLIRVAHLVPVGEGARRFNFFPACQRWEKMRVRAPARTPSFCRCWRRRASWMPKSMLNGIYRCTLRRSRSATTIDQD